MQYLMSVLPEPCQRTATLSMCAALVSMSVTFCCCYVMWLEHGCRAFMPYISDLGLHGAMAYVFLSGLVATAGFMFHTLPHLFLARHCLLGHLRVHAHWKVINGLVGIAGAVTALGVGVLGFFPWDRHLFWHLLCADLIFGGGFAWAAGSWMLARRFASASCSTAVRYTWDSCRCQRRLQLPVAVACVAVLSFATVCFAGAFLSDPSMFTSVGLAKTLQLANSNFDGYCTGRVGWHGLTWINFAALSEWIYVALLGSGVVLAAADLQAYSMVQRNLQSLLPISHASEEGPWWHFL